MIFAPTTTVDDQGKRSWIEGETIESGQFRSRSPCGLGFGRGGLRIHALRTPISHMRDLNDDPSF